MAMPVARARRIALAAQGLAGARPARATTPHIRKAIDRLGVLQIDSVNVLVRAHYMPLFSRLGAYPVEALDRMAYQDRTLFEYWGHQASLMPMDLYPAMRWRMRTVADGTLWKGFANWASAKRDVVEAVEREVADRGPLGVSDLAAPGRRSGPWWGWSDGKTALEWLYASGRLTVAGRRNFERLYDITARIVPAEHLNGSGPSDQESVRILVERAARALGIGTLKDIADYYNVATAQARPVVDDLVAAGGIERVEVEGWKQPAFLDASAKAPRAVAGSALVSPFDPLMFNRARVERLFGFDYRIEIYVPEPKRVYGYYVLPFLMGERFAGRVDLKADRKAELLRVPGAFAEPGADRSEVATALADELQRLAGWLGLRDVAIGRKGNLSSALKARV